MAAHCAQPMWQMLVFKMAAYLSTSFTSFPHIPNRCPPISKKAACPRWLPSAQPKWKMLVFKMAAYLTTLFTSLPLPMSPSLNRDIQDGCLYAMAGHEWCRLSKMAAYLNTFLFSLPLPMSPSLPRDIQDGCLSTMAAHERCYLSKVATSRRAHPRWLQV
jgi:hypothetical protein